jgi:GntR family transcriptional regulator
MSRGLTHPRLPALSDKVSLRSKVLPSVVRERIAAQIESGELRPGHRLPAEPTLAADYGVSRATLREALHSLEEDGFLIRTPGAGTFVTHRPRLTNNLDVNFGVTDLIRAKGLQPGTENLKIYEARASAAESEHLSLPEASGLVVVERVRTADGRPVVFSRDLIPAFLLEGHSGPLDDRGQGSIYDFYESELGIAVSRGVATIRPLKADRRLASLLRVRRGTLLLHFTQVDYDAFGRAVLLSEEDQVADAFEVSVVRRGPQGRTPVPQA